MGIFLFFARRRGLCRGNWKPVTPASVFRRAAGGLGGVERGDGSSAGMYGMKRGVADSGEALVAAAAGDDAEDADGEEGVAAAA